MEDQYQEDQGLEKDQLIHKPNLMFCHVGGKPEIS